MCVAKSGSCVCAHVCTGAPPPLCASSPSVGGRGVGARRSGFKAGWREAGFCHSEEAQSSVMVAPPLHTRTTDPQTTHPLCYCCAPPAQVLYLHRLLLQPVNSVLAFPVPFITSPPPRPSLAPICPHSLTTTASPPLCLCVSLSFLFFVLFLFSLFLTQQQLPFLFLSIPFSFLNLSVSLFYLLLLHAPVSHSAVSIRCTGVVWP